MIRVGVIGYGYWGPRLARNFASAPGSTVTMIADLKLERRQLAEIEHPQSIVTANWHDMLSGDVVDAIIVATPLSSHCEIAFEALSAQRHVLVEKPIAANPEEAIRLIDASEKANCVLMVDHTFIFTDAVRRIKQLIKANELGQIFYFDSVRVNLGLFQNDANVIYDLAAHDLAIMDFILDEKPTSISATGARHFASQSENIAFLTLFFGDSSLISHIHVNWLAPAKIRRTLIGGSRKMIVYDDLEPSEKLKIYDKGVEFADDPESIRKLMVSYRTGDLWVPNLEMGEPLQNMALHFIECIRNSKTPLTDGFMGLRIARCLEAADKSMARRGAVIDIIID